MACQERLCDSLVCTAARCVTLPHTSLWQKQESPSCGTDSQRSVSSFSACYCITAV